MLFCYIHNFIIFIAVFTSLMTRKITDQLFVGDKEDAINAVDKFDIIISLSHPPDESTKHYLIPDGPHRYDKFEKAVDCVINNLQKNKSVFVHCQAGISRSVSVCIAAHITYYNSNYENSYDICSHKTYHPSDELINSVKKYISH